MIILGVILQKWNFDIIILRNQLDSLGENVPNLLFIDRAPMNKINSLIKNIEKYDTELKIIASNMTRILQPLKKL